MPIYKQASDGKFVLFERTPFPDLEKVLEDWIEANPHLLLEGEDLIVIGRQPRTGFDKYLDLLAIDRTGAAVVIELKRGETPRDVVAQTLEYAAWVHSLSVEELDDMAKHYTSRRGSSVGLADLYDQGFPSEAEDGDADANRSADRVTFNNRQRLVIVAERITDEVEQTMRYLRTQLGADIYGVEFSVHKSGDDTLVTTTTKIGREQVVSKPAQSRVPRERESDESIEARVKTDFMKRVIKELEAWVEESGIPGLSIDHSTGSEHFVRHLGETWLYYYYAANWLYMVLYSPQPGEVEALKPRLSRPESLWRKENWTVWRFHVATDSDLDAVKDLIRQRANKKEGVTT